MLVYAADTFFYKNIYLKCIYFKRNQNVEIGWNQYEYRLESKNRWKYYKDLEDENGWNIINT